MSADLIARLEGLTGPCQRMDALIAVAAGDYRLVHIKDRDTWAVFDAPFERGKWAAASGMKSEADAIDTLSSFLSLKRFTTSIDAAVALVERCLPGWSYCIRPHFVELKHPTDPIQDQWGRGPVPAIAICTAALRALEAEGARDE